LASQIIKLGKIVNWTISDFDVRNFLTKRGDEGYEIKFVSTDFGWQIGIIGHCCED
jgi:hypothetical protein